MKKLNWMLLFAVGSKAGGLPVVSNPNGTVTAWTFGIWGPVGQSGKPCEGTVLRAARNKKERAAIAHAQAMYERSMKSQAALAGSHPHLVEDDGDDE